MQFDVRVCCRINVALTFLTHIVGRSSYRLLVARLGMIKARIAALCAQAPLQLLATMTCEILCLWLQFTTHSKKYLSS